ncbi:MAG TPA: alpha/beta hydrolase [Candidatus Polarisedimenticolia bacterium]|nr:alpha/beta hydrolase [Candidatus Polarisedimenticolia bacterium]
MSNLIMKGGEETMRIYKSVEGERFVRERYKAFLRRWPVPNQQIVVPTSQGETFVIVSGLDDAPALLLLHGGAANSAMWMGEVTAFAHFFRVYCIDMIGEPGLSAPARPALASDAHAAWLDDVLNHLGVARASILGVSLGGWLALDYAIRRPARVERVAVLCPGGIGRQKVGIVFATLLSRIFGRRGKRWLMERILGRAPVDPPPPVKAFLDFGALIHRHFRPRMVKLHFSDRALASVRVPLLAIVGARDVLFDSAQTKRRLETLVNGAQVVYLPEAGHMIAGQTARVLEFMSSGRN